MKKATPSKFIMAADEDPFADMGFDDNEDETIQDKDPSEFNSDDSVEDSLDNMADTLDSIDDALKDFKEDSVDIDIENNISDHYIAECELCHGIFITAISESDQKIEKISGACPLCDEDCDQYLNWIIRGI